MYYIYIYTYICIIPVIDPAVMETREVPRTPDGTNAKI